MQQDPYKYFRVEARELLDLLTKGGLDLEKGKSAAEIVSRLLRVAHTLKGAARVVKQSEIADHAHAIEGVLAPYRESVGKIPKEQVEIVLKRLDEVSRHLSLLKPPETGQSVSPVPIQADEFFRTVRTDIREMDDLLEGIAEVHTQLGELRRIQGSMVQARQWIEGVLDSRAGSKNGDSSGSRQLIVDDIRRVFSTMEENMIYGLDQTDRELKQVREIAERLRLLPAGVLFTSLERSARDVAQSLNKRVVFEASGAEIRLDAHVLGAVQSALVQIVRNAVAHGIEPEQERIGLGKSPEGRVTLQVFRRGRKIAFVCRDDGKGVDLESLRRIAQRKGLFSLEMQKLSSQEMMHLLLKGGLSTSGAVTEISGRGIGLDVLREAAESLGGDVTVQTQAGKGTTIELVVPLSLASIEVLMVESEGAIASIPLDSVRSTLHLVPEDITQTPQGETLLYEGARVPYIALQAVLCMELQRKKNQRDRCAVIVEGKKGLAALGIERLLGTSSVLLRPLPDAVPVFPVVAGASLDAQGQPQLVLDPDGIVDQAWQARAPKEELIESHSRILVIDDSLTTRMLEQSILESAGYEVDVATSGEEAMEKSRQKKYALFLVDVEMPGMDGFTFIERSRSDPLLRDIPSILVTSRASAEDRERGRKVGACAYIVKSEFDQGELLERIQKLVA